MASYGHVLIVNPHVFGLYISMANVYHDQGKYDQAL